MSSKRQEENDGSKKKAAAIRFAGGSGTDDRLRRLARRSGYGFLEGDSPVHGVCVNRQNTDHK